MFTARFRQKELIELRQRELGSGEGLSQNTRLWAGLRGRGGARPRGARLVDSCRGLGAHGHKNTAYVPGLRSTGLRTAIPAPLYARAPQLLADAGFSLRRRKPPHTASTMPRIDADLKLDFKDVLLRPKRSSLKSRAEVGAAGMPPSGWQGGSGCRGWHRMPHLCQRQRCHTLSPL